MTNSTIRQALQKSRLFLVVGAAIAIEFAIRLALGRGIHPFLYLLTPPVAGLLWFHLAAPISRGRHSDDDRRLIGEPPSGTLRPVLFLAVVGHAFAVVIGTALFFAVDTPIQAAMYWHGGHFRWPYLMFLWPAAGLLLGTSIAWTLPGLMLPGVRNGHSVTESFRRTIGNVRLWQFGKLVGVHLLVGIGLVLIAYIVGHIWGYFNRIPFEVLLLGIVPGLIIITFLTIPVTAAAVGHKQFSRAITSEDGNSGGISENANDVVGEHAGANSAEPTQNQSLLPVAVIIMLLLALGTLGGFARMTELQPTPTTEELGSNPDEMYASAVNNTQTGSTSWLYIIYGPDSSDNLRIRESVDRSDRHLYFNVLSREGSMVYVSTGVENYLRDEKSHAFQNFLSATDIDKGDHHTPGNYFSAIEEFAILEDDGYAPFSGWEIANESEEYINLTLTNATDAAQFAGVHANITPHAEFDVHASIGRESQRLEVLEARYDTNTSANDGLEEHWRATFDYNFDMERPDSLGSPSIEEYVWRALIY